MQSSLVRVSQFLFVSLVLLPILAGLLYTLMYAVGWTGLTAKGFTTEHFVAVFKEGYFTRALLYSLMQAVVGVGLALILSFALFYGLQLLKIQATKVLYLPLLVPPVVLGFAFFAFWSDSGWLARLVYQVGWIDQPNQFPDIVNGKMGVAILLAHLFLVVPFFTLHLLNSYQAQNIGKLRELAQAMGANLPQTVRWVELPILWAKIRGMALLYFIFIFGAYEIPLLLGAESQRMLSLVILDKLTRFDLLAKPQAYAMTLLYVIAVFMMLWMFFKTRKKAF